jgi:hypothetical protein
MTAVPIAFQSNEARYKFAGAPVLLNAYAEKNGNDNKAPFMVVPADGLVEFAEPTDTPCRGLIFMEDLDAVYSVHSSSVYKVLSDGTSSRIGTVPGIGPVQLSRNQKATPQILVRSDAFIQILESDTLRNPTDLDVPDDIVTADFLAGRHIVGTEDRTFNWTGINEIDSFDSTDFATFEQQAGKLVRIKEHGGELYGLCSRWTEVWRPTGNLDSPYEPMGATIPKGLLSANAVVESDSTLMWPSNEGIVGRLDRYQFSRVSNHEVEQLIQDDTAPADILGFSWSRGGHSFASFTGDEWTRVFDAATQVWHRRASYPSLDKWRARYSVAAWGKTIVGDSQTGKLFYLDSNTFTEDGEPLVWGMDSPTIHAFPNGGIVDAIYFDVAVGYGAVLASDDGFDPLMMLDWSVDGGNSWKGNRLLRLGKRGEFTQRVYARRLGRFGDKGIIFRIRISDPVVRAIVAADVKIRPLKR